MDKSGNNERHNKAPRQERVSLRVATVLQGVTRKGDISLNAAYPFAERALLEIRGQRAPIDSSTNLSEAAQNFFRPQMYGNSMANHLATASQSIGQPRFETTAPAQSPASQPEAPATQPEVATARPEVDPVLLQDPFAYFESQFPAQNEVAAGQAAAASLATTPEQAAYMQTVDSELNAAAAGVHGRGAMTDTIDLHAAEGTFAEPGYLADGPEAARRMVDAAYERAETPVDDSQLEGVR